MAERVRETCIQRFGEAFTLFIGKTGTSTVALGILQVDFLMGNVQIAADNNDFFLIQLADKLADSVIPVETMVNSCQFPLRIGCIAGDQIEIFIFQCDQTAFRISSGTPTPCRTDSGGCLAKMAVPEYPFFSA